MPRPSIMDKRIPASPRYRQRVEDLSRFVHHPREDGNLHSCFRCSGEQGRTLWWEIAATTGVCVAMRRRARKRGRTILRTVDAFSVGRKWQRGQ